MQGRQISLPPISKTNKLIMASMVGAFLIISALKIAGLHISHYLVLSKPTFLGYQLFTYGFVEANIISLIFNALLFWFLGGELEKNLGAKFYKTFLASSFIGAGVIFLATSFIGLGSVLDSYQGMGSLMMAMLTAYAVLYSERELHFMFFFPLKARYFCLLIAAIQMYGAFFSANKISALTHLLTMGLAYGILLLRSRQKGRQRRKEEFKKYQKEALKKSFKLIKNDDENNDPRYWQ